MKSSKQKGKLLEDYVADQIVAKGIDPRARRDGASGAGNREKGDICTSMMVLGQNAGIEVKNQKTLCIPDWWRQCKKLESLSREPILVFKINNAQFSDTLATVYLDTLLELIKAAREPTETIQKGIEYHEAVDNWQKRRDFENLKSAITKAIKHLE